MASMRRETNVSEMVIRVGKTRGSRFPSTTSPKPEQILMRFFPEFKDEGEVVASFGSATLIRFLDGKTELRGGSNDDRTAASEVFGFLLPSCFRFWIIL